MLRQSWFLQWLRMAGRAGRQGISPPDPNNLPVWGWYRPRGTNLKDSQPLTWPQGRTTRAGQASRGCRTDHYRNFTVVGILLMALLGGIGGGVTRDVLLDKNPGRAHQSRLHPAVPGGRDRRVPDRLRRGQLLCWEELLAKEPADVYQRSNGRPLLGARSPVSPSASSRTWAWPSRTWPCRIGSFRASRTGITMGCPRWLRRGRPAGPRGGGASPAGRRLPIPC